MNAYVSGSQKAVPGTLVYLRSGSRWLMMHRVSRSGDVHFGKWNGLGGKLEPGESFMQGAQREVAEESGFQVSQLELRGFLQFPNFIPQRNEDYLVAVYVAQLEAHLSEQPLHFKNPEGRLEWVDEKKVLGLEMWEGDLIFLPHVLSGAFFSGCFWYEKGRLDRHEITLIRT